MYYNSLYSDQSKAQSAERLKLSRIISYMLAQKRPMDYYSEEYIPMTRGQIKILQEAGCRLIMGERKVYFSVDENLNIHEHEVV